MEDVFLFYVSCVILNVFSFLHFINGYGPRHAAEL